MLETVLRTDAIKMELFGHSEQRHVWRRKDVQFHEKNTFTTVNNMGVLITFWACVTVSVENANKWQQILGAGNSIR